MVKDMKKWTYEDVKKYIELFNYQLLSEKDEIINKEGFVLTSTYLLVKCIYHKPYKVKWGNFKYGKRCPICGEKSRRIKRRFDYEYVKELIENENYKLLSTEYKGCEEKILLRCPKGHEYEVAFSNFKQGNRCPYCNKGIRLDYEYVKEYITSFGYKLLSTEYINNHTKLLMECNNNHKFEITYGDFQQGNRCPYCSHKSGKVYLYDSFGYNHFDKVCMNWSDKNKISPFEISCHNDRKCIFYCHECNTEFEKSITKITDREQWCPNCKMSKGEKRIRYWLENNNINYIYEKMFNDLLGIGNGLLSYDFYLPDYNLLIEYQGEQHEHQCGIFGGEDKFKIQQEHDRRKREYAERNNIKLLEIWYWDFDNIEEILKEMVK